MSVSEQKQQDVYFTEVPLQDCSCLSPQYTPIWKKLKATTPIAPPSERGGHSATYLSSTSCPTAPHSVLIFGGSNRTARFYQDIHLFDLQRQSWKVQQTTGKKPTGRSGHIAVIHGSRLIIFGGQHVSLSNNEPSLQFFSDLWSLDLKSWHWTELHITGTPLPQRNGATGLVIEDQLYLTGGSDNQGPATNIIKIDLLSMHSSIVQTQGDEFDARELHGAVSISANNGADGAQILVTGGRSENGILNSFYALHLASNTWRTLGTAPARCGHILHITHTQTSQTHTISTSQASSSLTPMIPSLLMFGGTDGLTFFNDLTVYQAPTSTSTTHSVCTVCNGPAGWCRLGGGSKADTENKESQTQTQTQSQTLQASTENKDEKNSSKTKRKKKVVDNWPLHRFAHTMTSVQLPVGEDAYFVFGGMNDDRDFNDTFLLQLSLVDTGVTEV